MFWNEFWNTGICKTRFTIVEKKKNLKKLISALSLLFAEKFCITVEKTNFVFIFID
jgi:hypothetical protein